MTETRARERDQRRLMAEQAALRRVATAVAASTDPRRVFGVVTEEVARLLRAQSSNMVRFNDDVTATVVGGWSEGEVRNVPVGDTVRSTATPPRARVYRTRRAGADRRLRRDSTASWPRTCAGSASAAPSRRRSSSTGGCGAR